MVGSDDSIPFKTVPFSGDMLMFGPYFLINQGSLNGTHFGGIKLDANVMGDF